MPMNLANMEGGQHITTADDVKLEIYETLEPGSPASSPTLIMFHGNAMSMIAFYRSNWRRLGCNVVMISYRGYGNSEGKPTHKGLKMDADAVLDYVRKHQVLGSTKIILYGLSTGGAVAIDLASRNPGVISGLIIENTWFSFFSLVMSKVSILAFLVGQCWNSGSALRKITPFTKVLLMSGRRDSVVPPKQMDMLKRGFDKRGIKTTMKEFPGGEHGDTDTQPGYWSTLRKFIVEIAPDSEALTGARVAAVSTVATAATVVPTRERRSALVSSSPPS